VPSRQALRLAPRQVPDRSLGAGGSQSNRLGLSLTAVVDRFAQHASSAIFLPDQRRKKEKKKRTGIF
jgi:hypothetical protein